MVRARLLRLATSPLFSLALDAEKDAGYCFACGQTGSWQYVPVINDDLTREWELNDQLRRSFSCRESMFCATCRSSLRLRRIAEALTAEYGEKSLAALVRSAVFRELQVAEINSCGTIHEFLKELPTLRYSEYGSKKQLIPSEDLEWLSYDDTTFDLVLTSDTLEHVPDFPQALREIFRVLKPGGKHIFTVPTILGRKTVERAVKQADGSIENSKQPSYHGAGEPDYLVFREFGFDVIDKIRAVGFGIKVFRPNLLNLADSGFVFIATKPGTL